MANQPPNRPWFRLASIARPAPPMAPAPMAPPPARPTVSLGAPQEPSPPPPTTRVGSAPRNSPQVINAPAIKTNSPLPSKSVSPPLRNSVPSSPKVVYTATAGGVSPKSSPIKTPPVSRQMAAPPSPLLLPPSQVETRIPPEAEQKTVLVERKQQQPNDGAGGEGKEKGSKKQQQVGMRVITIAGENRGAYMELGHGLTKKQPTTSGSGTESNDRSGNMLSSPPMRAFTNSNVQGINNSIVFNASCKDNNPGVHLTLSRNGNGNGNGFYTKEHVNGHHTT